MWIWVLVGAAVLASAGLFLAGAGIALNGVQVVPESVARAALGTAKDIASQVQLQLTQSISQLSESTNRVLQSSEKTATEMQKIPHAFQGMMISNYILMALFSAMTILFIVHLFWRIRLDREAEEHRIKYHDELIQLLGLLGKKKR